MQKAARRRGSHQISVQWLSLSSGAKMSNHIIHVSAAYNRLVLEPRQQFCMHSTDAGRVDEVNIRPVGYQWTVPVSVPKLYDTHEARTSQTTLPEARSLSYERLTIEKTDACLDIRHVPPPVLLI